MKSYKFDGQLLDRLIKLKAGSLGIKKSELRKQICESLGITKQTMSNWINNNSPDLNRIFWLKNYFGLDFIDTFFKEYN